jgi:hypothetical protein
LPAIRLKYPIRVGKEVFPNNAVFDATDDVADMLVEGRDGFPCAELTDAIERYPVGQPLTHVDDWPLSGGEKFPLDPENPPPVPVGAFVNHVDRIIARRLANTETPPQYTSKEPAPAHVEVTAADRKRGEQEQADAEAAAATAGAIPVRVVEEPKPTKAKH